MAIIEVDGKQYDPYFILDVSRDDSDEHIAKAFRRKVIKYHPDKWPDPEKKEKYEKYFKILSESFYYIKERRKVSNIDVKKRKEELKKEKYVTKTFDKQDTKKFNEEFDEKKGKIKSNKKDIEKEKESEREKEIIVINQFKNKKMSKREFQKKFNKMFEYIASTDPDDQEEEKVAKSLVHKTTDGFFAYNSADVKQYGLVNTFNGLMIVDDDFEESGTGYWDNQYSDYNKIYKRAKNPDTIIKVPKTFKTKFEPKKADASASASTEQVEQIEQNEPTNYATEETKIYKRTFNDLLEKEKRDKEFVMKNLHMYDQNTVSQALNDQLDKTPSYLATMQKYIK